MARVLAIDFGKKRTGIAVTDQLQIIASGLTTINTNELIPFLKNYISKEKGTESFVYYDTKQRNGVKTAYSSKKTARIQKIENCYSLYV